MSRIFATPFADISPLYVTMLERNGRTPAGFVDELPKGRGSIKTLRPQPEAASGVRR